MNNDTLAAARRRVREMTAAGNTTADALAEVLAEAMDAKALASRAPLPMMDFGAAGGTPDAEFAAARDTLLKSDKPVKVKQLAAVALGLREMIELCVGKLVEHAQRLKELEKQPLAYDGPFEQGKCYSKGTFTTHDGSLWHCNTQTTSRPGDGPAWTLAVKRGRDGR